LVVVEGPPPPRRPRSPLVCELAAGTELVRIFEPGRHGATATSFRHYGPLHRFDHHDGGRSGAGVDAERGVYYAALRLSGCLVEVFGDDGIVETAGRVVALPVLRRGVTLLDLRGRGAMRAGTKAALAKVRDRALTQAWARHFYEETGVYGRVDGLIYPNAHNDQAAILLFERARDALDCPPQRILDLQDEALRPEILATARDNDLEPPGVP